MSVEPEVRGDEDPQEWFREHFDGAAQQVLDFLDAPDGGLADRTVGDVGCGDGVIDLGLTIKGRPRQLIGYDVRPTDVDALRRMAAAAGVAEGLPEALSFATSGIDQLPAEDDTFDVVVTWSVFEHVSHPVRMLSEISRVLKPDGILFLQLWPFYYSEHGGHLWPHYDGEFPHLRHTDEEIREHLRGQRGTDATRRDAVDEYESLNRITVDQLQNAILAAGMTVTKLQLLTSAVHIPLDLGHMPLSLLGVGGVKLLAVLR
jgi:SAM-dependent methyltransferase